jgi:hypothetical protein
MNLDVLAEVELRPTRVQPAQLAGYEIAIVQLLGGGFQAASCYISHSMQPALATADYVERILAPARSHGFPDWYLARLSSFNPD